MRQTNPEPFAVADLAGFLTGRWRLARRIVDLGRGVTGRLTGEAAFTPAPCGLRYAEAGVLSFDGYRGEAARAYWFALDGASAAAVRFADGRPFHHVDLSSGAAEVAHDCPPDRYWGRYAVVGWDCWSLGWRIEGPGKRLEIASRYRREGG